MTLATTHLATPTLPAPQREPERPFDAERTLALVSRLLVSGGGDLLQLLELLCGALGTRSAYFAFAPEPFILPAAPFGADGLSDAATPALPSSLFGQVVTWPLGRPLMGPDMLRPDSGEGHAREIRILGHEDGIQTYAIPLLTDEDRFVGYLGFEQDGGEFAVGEAPWRVLPVIGDLIGAHLRRLAAEEARAQSQERWQSLVDRHPDAIVVTVDELISYANATATRLFGGPESALRGRHLHDFLSAADESSVAARRSEQLASAAPLPFEHTLIRPDGSERVVESLSVPFPGIATAVQTVLRDVSERNASEERYRTFIETISEGVWRVDLDAPLAGGTEPDLEAEHILAHGRLAELNPAMRRMFWERVADPLGQPVRNLTGPYGTALFRALAESGHRLHNYEMAVRAPGEDTRFVSINAAGRFEHDTLVGVWGSCTEITDRVEMESGMVDALEEQQERIGRDLHDSVGQLLTGARMLSENLAHRVRDEANATTARRIADYTAEAIDRVRAICRGLVPPQLYQEGVAGALAELVTHADALNLTRCVYQHDGRADLREPDAALQFYRIAQEAISNALKHAHAATVWVSFQQDGPNVVMEVRDDGVGFEPDSDRPRSIGLYSIRRRAHSVGALLTVETRVGQGTAVRVLYHPSGR